MRNNGKAAQACDCCTVRADLVIAMTRLILSTALLCAAEK
jgi:hypothetical protein